MSSSSSLKSQDIVCEGNTVVAVSERGQLLLNLSGNFLSTTSLSLSKSARAQVVRSMVAGRGYLHGVQIYPGSDLSAGPYIIETELDTWFLNLLYCLILLSFL